MLVISKVGGTFVVMHFEFGVSAFQTLCVCVCVWGGGEEEV